MTDDFMRGIESLRVAKFKEDYRNRGPEIMGRKLFSVRWFLKDGSPVEESYINADRVEVTPIGCLILLIDSDVVVASFSPGCWSDVRKFAEADADNR